MHIFKHFIFDTDFFVNLLGFNLSLQLWVNKQKTLNSISPVYERSKRKLKVNDFKVDSGNHTEGFLRQQLPCRANQLPTMLLI